LIGGLLAPDAGRYHADGARVTEPGPERGIVFQQYSLLPWMSVFEQRGARGGRGQPRALARERAAITDEFIALVNLTPARWKRPRELSAACGSAWRGPGLA